MSPQPIRHDKSGTCPMGPTLAENITYAFYPAGPTDSRSPCPALNTLANHGFLPHDGKQISAHMVARGLQDGFNCSSELAHFLSYGGFLLLGQYGRTICLADLARHNRIEHNASLAHDDAGPRDEYAPTTPSEHHLRELLAESHDGRIMTTEDVARARLHREAAYPEALDALHAVIARGEMAIALNLFNNPELPSAQAEHELPSISRLLEKLRPCTLATPSTAPQPLPGVPLQSLQSWLRDERLP
ncbi:heme-thiolate peroxidase, partial [Gelatoporia subvermispora B]